MAAVVHLCWCLSTMLNDAMSGASLAIPQPVVCATCSEAGPDTPLWPDPEASDLAQNGAPDAHSKMEAFAFAPPWLVSAWAQRGSSGYWSTRPPQVGCRLYQSPPASAVTVAAALSWYRVLLETTCLWFRPPKVAVVQSGLPDVALLVRQ